MNQEEQATEIGKSPCPDRQQEKIDLPAIL